jgi:hypothetical protein
LIRYLKLIIGFVVFLFVFSLGCAQTVSNDKSIRPENNPTAVNTEIITQDEIVSTPVEVNTTIEKMVPYSKTSIWNNPIKPSSKYDPHSDEMIAALVNEGPFTSNPDQYSFTVYFADENTPRWDIPCLEYTCTVFKVTDNAYYSTKILNDVPIPTEAQPSLGSDSQMIVIDKTTFTEYDFWRAERLKAGWVISNGSVYNTLWDGTPSNYGSRGAGLPYYAGLIRPWEIIQGHINHALSFGYSETARDRCVFPATKTDGRSSMSDAIPEGARLQLDPSLTEVDFDSMGLDRTGKIIARAMQDYGMFLIDTSGRTKVYAEDLVNNPYATQKWTDPELNLTDKTISAIPITSFRVLEFPSAYWDSSADSYYHGECFTFPGIP